MKDFEMADGNNPEEIIMATQRSLIAGLRAILKDLEKSVKSPGLTWEQIDYFLEKFGERKPEIIIQEHET